MDNYLKALNAMNEKFGCDYQFVLATVSDNRATQRFVDAYYDGERFYIVAYALSGKVRDITENPAVSLYGRNAHCFSGTAEVLGHPLKSENKPIRDKLIDVFSEWYFLHNNEFDENMCFIGITPEKGFFHKDGVGYCIDFNKKTADIAPFEFNFVMTED